MNWVQLTFVTVGLLGCYFILAWMKPENDSAPQRVAAVSIGAVVVAACILGIVIASAK